MAFPGYPVAGPLPAEPSMTCSLKKQPRTWLAHGQPSLAHVAIMASHVPPMSGPPRALTMARPAHSMAGQ
jgi:hypothetical protein